MAGYCSTEDVQDVLQQADSDWGSGALSTDFVTAAIEGLTDWVEEATHKHWYVDGGASDDSNSVIPTSPNSRDDEHSFPTWGGYVVGEYDDVAESWTTTSGTVFQSHSDTPDAKEEIRLTTGELSEDDTDDINAYTRIRLARKNCQTVNSLNIVNESGGYDDWTSTQTGGVGNANRGDDWWVRINNQGVSELYIDVHTVDDDIQTVNNAVYVDFDYGQDSIPNTVRRGVAFLAAAELVMDDEVQAQVPDQGQLVNIETKAQRYARRGLGLLENHFVDGRPRPPFMLQGPQANG